ENDSDRLSQIFFGLGRILLIEKKHVEALKLFKEVESNMVYTHEKVGLAVCYENIAQVFYQMGRYDSALIYGRKANFFVNSTRFGVNKMEINLLLSNVFKAINNNDSSIHYLRKHLILKDSIIQQDITTQITLANSNYEFEKMENKFSQELLTSQRRKNVFILLTSILFAISIIVFVFFRSIKKARKKSEELLLNILPKHTTEELKNYGKAIPRHHESVSIMFCDVQNFTIISEKLSPDFLVNMLDFYFSKFDDIITDHGIEKIKTIGDAYMCAAGLTPNGENHAKSAVNAAIEMMAFVKDIENFMMEKYGNAFHFRIGIHSGEVVSGVVGKKKYAYDIWGDTVNLAARMEQNSMPGEINITKTTLDMLNDEYRTTSRGNISAKNKGEVAMYFVNAK
ncbi:MAG: tetratricopeptide repeat protein, partial [Bacteroidia bacterium]|nr:tetratricopeptide repeat protein [Bacteroidia bacterium]